MALTSPCPRSSGTRPRRAGAVLVAVAAAVLPLTGCTELERPEAYAPTPTSALAAGQQVEPASDEAAPVDRAVVEFVPSPPRDYLPYLLIPTDQGVLRSGGSAAQAIEGVDRVATIAAYDDMVGGLVVEEQAGGELYLPAQGEPVPIGDASTRLLDVGYWGGSPRAFLQVAKRRIDQIQLVPEQGGGRARLEHVTLAEGETVVDFSASGGLQALITADDACGDLRFFGIEGEQLDTVAPPAPECAFNGRPSFGAVSLSPDSSAVAYTEVTYRGDGTEAGTALKVRELLSEEPFFTFRIGEDLDRIESISFDGTRVAYTKETDADIPVWLIDLASSEQTEVNTRNLTPTGSVSFARIPLS